MGCRNDYMVPTENERKSQEACQNICYVYKQTGLMELPDWAKAGAESAYGTMKADAVGFLCDLLREMSVTEREALIYGDPRSRPRRRLADWWEEHLENDAERDARKRTEVERERLRSSALAKLTPEERRALGI